MSFADLADTINALKKMLELYETGLFEYSEWEVSTFRRTLEYLDDYQDMALQHAMEEE